MSIRKAFVDDFVADSGIYSEEAQEAVRDYLLSMPSKKLVER